MQQKTDGWANGSKKISALNMLMTTTIQELAEVLELSLNSPFSFCIIFCSVGLDTPLYIVEVIEISLSLNWPNP